MVIKGIAGGICIGLAALANVLAPSPIVGAILFCFGLFTILAFDFKLCTGMFGSCDTLQDWQESALILGANQFGAAIIGIIAYVIYGPFSIIVYDSSIWIVLLKSVLCGAMIHFGVQGYKRGHPLVLALSIVIFVLCGWEHCVANVALIFMTNTKYITDSFIINILGNALGAKLIDLLLK